MADDKRRKTPRDDIADLVDSLAGQPPAGEPPPAAGRPAEAEPAGEGELTKEQQRIRERRARRATFDLPPAIREKLADLSIEYGVPQSQIVALLLLHGFERIEAGEIDPAERREKSTSPKFAFNLVLDDLLKRLKE